MSKKKKANKAIRNKYGSKTLKELETEGLVPENFHLFDSIEMEEYNKKFPGFKEYNQKMTKKMLNDKPPAYYLVKRRPEYAKNGVIVKQNQKNKRFSESTVNKNTIPRSSKLKLNDIIYVYSKDYGIYAKGKVTNFGKINYFESVEEVIAFVKNNKKKDYAYWFKLITEFQEAKSIMKTEKLIYHEYIVDLKLLKNSISADISEIKNLKNIQLGFYKLKEKEIKTINNLIKNPVTLKVNKLQKTIPGKLRQDLYSLFNKKFNLSVWIDIDHFVPQSVGGPGNIIQNLVPMGLSLNRFKGNSIPSGLFYVAKIYPKLSKYAKKSYLKMHSSSPCFISKKDILTVNNDASKITEVVNRWEISKVKTFYGNILKEHHPKYYELIKTLEHDSLN